MRHRGFFPAGALTLGLVLAGCGGPGAAVDGYQDADLTTKSNAALFATGSAPDVLFVGYGLVVGANPKSVCPKVKDDGTTVTLTGGCTDGSGDAWYGTATFVRSHGSLSLGSTGAGISGTLEYGTATYDGFGSQNHDTCSFDGTTEVVTDSRFTGTFTIGSGGSQTADFSANLRADTQDTRTSCTPTAGQMAIVYSGSVRTDGSGRSTWNGSGRFGTRRDGKVRATSRDEVLDDAACGSEAASGTTTLEAGGHTVVVTYDGATACTNPPAARWSLDGKAQGALDGVGCAAAPGRGGMPGLLSVGTVLGLVALRRRHATGGR